MSAMPLLPAGPRQQVHRGKVADANGPVLATRNSNKRQIAAEPRAQAALRKEYERLEAKRSWFVDAVRERADVEAEAQRACKAAHFANALELSSVKHEELALEFSKYKGKAVVQGDNLTDESGLAAVFADAAST